MNITQEEFFNAVEKMRECQKEYFRTRYTHMLNAAKKCENKVDVFIKEIRAEQARLTQPEMF